MKKIILSILLLKSNYNMELDKIANEIYSKPIMINKNYSESIILNLFLFNNKSKNENGLMIQQIENSINNQKVTTSDAIIEKLYNYLQEDIFGFITKQKHRTYITHNPKYILYDHRNNKKDTMIYLEPKIIQNTKIPQETLYIIVSEKNSNFNLEKILNDISTNKNTEYNNNEFYTTQNTITNTSNNIIHNKYSNIILCKKEENNRFKKIAPAKEIKDIYISIYNEEKNFEGIFNCLNIIIQKINNENGTASIEPFKEYILEFIKKEEPKDKIEKIKTLSQIITIFNTNYNNQNYTDKERLSKIIKDLLEDHVKSKKDLKTVDNIEIFFNDLIEKNPNLDNIFEQCNDLKKNTHDANINYYIENQKKNISNFIQEIHKKQ